MNDIDRAVAVLRAGGLVAIPTETVYGLAADASNPGAVAKIFAVKQRPVHHPLIVHIAAAEQLDDWAATIPSAAAVLADACWPGPLTLLVPRAARVLDVVTGGLDTVGVRVPAHPLTLALLTEFGGGLAAPSANRFGRVSPTTAEHVRADLGDDVGFVLDGGPCPGGVESTIVDVSGPVPRLLRPGGIAREEIERVLGAGAVAMRRSTRLVVVRVDTPTAFLFALRAEEVLDLIEIGAKAPGLLQPEHRWLGDHILDDAETPQLISAEELLPAELRALYVADAGDDV